MIRIFSRTLSILIIMFFCGCMDQTQDLLAVKKVLNQRRQALCSKDLPLYYSLLSPGYRDKNQDILTKKKELSATFASCQSINYRSDDVVIDIKGDRAVASARYSLKFVIAGQDLNLEGDEVLRLHKEAGEWKIVGGL